MFGVVFLEDLVGDLQTKTSCCQGPDAHRTCKSVLLSLTVKSHPFCHESLV